MAEDCQPCWHHVSAITYFSFQRRHCGFLIDVRHFGPTFILVDQIVRASNIYCSRTGLEIFSLRASFCQELTPFRIQFSRLLPLVQESLSFLPAVVYTPIPIFTNCSILISWVECFLRWRTFQVKINWALYRTVEAISGVPLGSVVGKILFVIYIYGLIISLNSKSCMFRVFLILNHGSGSIII